MAKTDLLFMDVNQLLEQFKVPGVDVSAIMKRGGRTSRPW